MTDRDEPIVMQPSSTDKVDDIAVGYTYNMIIGQGGDTFFWGNFFTTEDDGAKKDTAQGIVLESKVGYKAKLVACGPNHAALVKLSEELYTWGFNTEGALGIGKSSKKYCALPQTIHSLRHRFDKNKEQGQGKMEGPAKPGVDAGAEPGAEAEGAAVEEKKEEEGPEGKGKKAKNKRAKAYAEISDSTTIPQLQKFLKDEGNCLTQNRLIKKQIGVSSCFDKFMKLFLQVKKNFAEAISIRQTHIVGLICRLETGPFSQKRRFNLLVRKRKEIKENGSYLKEIFKAIYLHPCYLKNMIYSLPDEMEFINGLAFPCIQTVQTINMLKFY